jgi:TonB family protein
MRSLLIIGCALAAFAAADPLTPARYRSGALPAIPVQALGGGQVFAELGVTDAGTVDAVRLLRTTPPFTDPLVDAVRGWQFDAAEERTAGRRRFVGSTVLVAGVFRPAVLMNGPVAGEPPRDVGVASPETPFPIAPIVPAFPPAALASGVVLIEVQIDASGAVTGARVVRSTPPFDGPALDAARQWTFRPARRQGQPAATFAYIFFGFRQPVT